MTQQAELGVIARPIIDENLYMTLATADESGLPWASPVYYASEEYRAFYWVSAPEATHSRNVAVRRQASIVIFDSHTPINAGTGRVHVGGRRRTQRRRPRPGDRALLAAVGGAWSGRVGAGERPPAGPASPVPRARV
jgi:hypothetical protein